MVSGERKWKRVSPSPPLAPRCNYLHRERCETIIHNFFSLDPIRVTSTHVSQTTIHKYNRRREGGKSPRSPSSRPVSHNCLVAVVCNLVTMKVSLDHQSCSPKVDVCVRDIHRSVTLGQFIYDQLSWICQLFYYIKCQRYVILLSKKYDKSMSFGCRWIGPCVYYMSFIDVINIKCARTGQISVLLVYTHFWSTHSQVACCWLKQLFVIFPLVASLAPKGYKK